MLIILVCNVSGIRLSCRCRRRQLSREIVMSKLDTLFRLQHLSAALRIKRATNYIDRQVRATNLQAKSLIRYRQNIVFIYENSLHAYYAGRCNVSVCLQFSTAPQTSIIIYL